MLYCAIQSHNKLSGCVCTEFVVEGTNNPSTLPHCAPPMCVCILIMTPGLHFFLSHTLFFQPILSQDNNTVLPSRTLSQGKK